MPVEILYIAGTRGACGGVNMAVNETRWALDLINQTCAQDKRPEVWANHAIVHNVPQMERLQACGLNVFENNWDLVPDHSVVIGSAHGSPKEFPEIANQKGCFWLDLSCPLVIGNQKKVSAANMKGSFVVVIGKSGHPEAESYRNRGINGNIDLIEKAGDVSLLEVPESQQITVVTQTTLAVRAMNPILVQLETRFKDRVMSPTKLSKSGVRRGDTCGATDYRQEAVVRLVNLGIQGLVVVGSSSSHNSRELAIIAKDANLPTILAERAHLLEKGLFENLRIVGLTAGASADESETGEFIDWFKIENPSIQITETDKVDPNEKDYFPLKGKEKIEQELLKFLKQFTG